MSPRLTIILGLLLMSGWGTGFKTKMCDHGKIVEGIKKIYDCALKSVKGDLKDGKDPLNAIIYGGQDLEELMLCYQEELKRCVPPEQLSLMKSNPLEVVETDNKCKMEQLLYTETSLWGKAMDCLHDWDSESEGGKITPELCSKLGTRVERCVLDLQSECFSERENKVLAEIVKTAFSDVKEIYVMNEVQKIVEEDLKEIYECGLGLTSVSGSGRSSLMVGVLLPLLLFLDKF